MTTTDFLNRLNGNNNGSFKQWLEAQTKELRIAWYPSSGTDMRDLLYMRDGYYKMSGIESVTQPNVYIHTDYLGAYIKEYMDKKVWFKDRNTSMTVKWHEQLLSLDIPFHKEFVDLSADECYNEVHVVMMEVVSDKLGAFEVPVIFCFVENTAFCAQEVLANNVQFTHICRVRYGTGMGGARNDGFWIVNILKDVGCELFITDNHYTRPRERSEVRLFPAIKAAEDRIFAQLPQMTSEQKIAVINRARQELSRGQYVEHGCHDLYKLINKEQRLVDKSPLDRFEAAYWYKVKI